MLRVILIITILVLLLSAFFLPKFRRALWITLAVVVSLIATIIWLDNRERERANRNFPITQVELQDMQAKPGLNARAYVVNGRVLNHSLSDTLTQVLFEVNVKDCDGGDCQVIAEEQGRVSLVIPPGQARDFQVSVPFSSSIVLQGKPKWEYKVIDVNDR